MQRIEVMFCGNSVYLSGLAASLRQDVRLRVTQLDAPPDKVIKDLELMCPDVVVAEAVDACVARVLRKKNPFTLVIAVQAATDSLAILDERQALKSSVRDLARVIAENAAGKHAQDRKRGSGNKEEPNDGRYADDEPK